MCTPRLGDRVLEFFVEPRWYKVNNRERIDRKVDAGLKCIRTLRWKVKLSAPRKHDSGCGRGPNETCFTAWTPVCLCEINYNAQDQQRTKRVYTSITLCTWARSWFRAKLVSRYRGISVSSFGHWRTSYLHYTIQMWLNDVFLGRREHTSFLCVTMPNGLSVRFSPRKRTRRSLQSRFEFLRNVCVRTVSHSKKATIADRTGVLALDIPLVHASQLTTAQPRVGDLAD